MSLRESELSRSRVARRTHQKQTKRSKQKRKLEIARERKQRLDLLPAVLNDNQVLRFSEWCSLNDISPRTARRLFARGDGPATTQLSPKRVGITVRANKEWQARRERA
jgi:hypothetical protein